MTDLPATATFAEFAAIIRRRRSYVTALRKSDRLVLDGKRVNVAESIARIEATKDPSKAGVAARHAAARIGSNPAPPAGVKPTPPVNPPESDDEVGYQHWKVRTEKAKALAAERENAIADGKLLDAGDVRRIVVAAVTALRTRLESYRNNLVPQMIGIHDEARLRALLTETMEHDLHEAARQFAALAKGQGA